MEFNIKQLKMIEDAVRLKVVQLESHLDHVEFESNVLFQDHIYRLACLNEILSALRAEIEKQENNIIDLQNGRTN